MVKTLTRARLRRMIVSEVRRLREDGPRGGDPHDFSSDERMSTMIELAFDLAQDFDVPAIDIVDALGSAVMEGDQR